MQWLPHAARNNLYWNHWSFYVDTNIVSFRKIICLTLRVHCVRVRALHKVMQELSLPVGDSVGMKQKEGLDEAQRWVPDGCCILWCIVTIKRWVLKGNIVPVTRAKSMKSVGSTSIMSCWVVKRSIILHNTVVFIAFCPAKIGPSENWSRQTTFRCQLWFDPGPLLVAISSGGPSIYRGEGPSGKGASKEAWHIRFRNRLTLCF